MKFILLAILLALVIPAFSADKAANYAGTWTLDKTLSKTLPAYYDRVKSHTIVNTQDDGHLNVAVEVDVGQKDTDKIGFNYALDGSLTKTESKIRMQNGLTSVPTTLQATVTAGGQLHIVITREITMNGETNKSVGTEDWQLSPDGKTLHVHRVDTSPRGKADMEMVFVKG